jgi:hypothetical protein
VTNKKVPTKKVPIRKPMQMAAKAVQRQFTMLPSDSELIDQLRFRYQRQALLVRSEPADIAKSEVVRAGLHSLRTMSDKQLYAEIEAIEELKEGRPKKVSAEKSG